MKSMVPPAPIEKVLTGIQGFDEITGGLPRGRTTLVRGGPGSGKTIFALQALVHGAQRGKDGGVFVAFEESARQIVANAATFGWDLQALEKRLFLLDARLSPEAVKSGEFDLLGMLHLLQAKAGDLRATCVVFDGLDVLLGLLDDPAAERREVYRIRDWLLETGLTGIITQKVDGTSLDQRYEFLQFVVDCVVVLTHEVDEGAAFRNLRVSKYRGSGFSGDEFPMAITAEGLQITHRGPTELVYEVTDERVSSGLPGLDEMLRGGFYRGSNVLISGAPGTAKSTLCGLFAAAACARGERTLFVSFDEGAAQIVRNLRSVGIRLAPHLKSGLLKVYSTRTRGPNIADQFGDLRALVRTHKPRCLVLDPLSVLSSKLVHFVAVDVSRQFLDFLKREGITVVNTSLMEGLSTDEATKSGISTIADTWIHLAYVLQDGERNRTLTVVESRGTGHSNLAKELTLSDERVSLTEVFTADGRVLLGAARREWERAARAERARTQNAAELALLRLELAQVEATAHLKVLQKEVKTRGAEIALLSAEAKAWPRAPRSAAGRRVAG